MYEYIQSVFIKKLVSFLKANCANLICSDFLWYAFGIIDIIRRQLVFSQIDAH